MAQLTGSFILLVSCYFLKGNFQELCKKNVDKIREENRKCVTPCSPTTICANGRCLCDGPCAWSCIALDHVCKPPENFTSGSISAPDGFEIFAEIQYVCDEGYELTGVDKRSCRGDESWSGEEPRCVNRGIRCGPPTFKFPKAVLDAFPIKDEYFEGDELSYKCDVGFFDTADNSHITTCKIDDGNANWTSISPNCEPKTCPRPTSIPNGYYEGTDFTFGKSVNYSCNQGYYLVGAENLICLSDEWASFPPKCEAILCSQLPNPSNGSVSHKSLKYRSNARYTCNDGYVLSGGDRVRVCGENGKWDGKEPKCIIAQCDPPDEPKNGFITNQSGFLINSRVEYDCYKNASTTGFTSAICTLDDDTAKWSVPPPVCTLKCEVKELENAYITINETTLRIGESLRHGSSIVFRCKDGYEIPSTISTTSTTLDAKCSEGRWSPTIECVSAYCLKSKILKHKLDERNLEFPTNIADEVPIGSKVLLNCRPEYPEKDVDSYLICSRGSWSYPEKLNDKCNRKSCEIGNFGLQFSWNETTSETRKKIAHGVQVELRCTQRGYELYENDELVQNSSNKIVKCTDGKLSSSTSFECKPGPCKCADLKNVIRNKGMETTRCTDYVESGKEEQLRCSRGFSGPAKLDATCNRKTWVVNAKCIQNCNCSDMRLDKSLKIGENCTELVENGKSFTVECADDYGHFAGKDRVVKCTGGKWDVPNVYCEAPCYVPDIKNGTVYIATMRHSKKVYQNTKIGAGIEITVTCEKGFELVPSLKSTNGRVRCMDGNWTVVPTCEPTAEESTARRSTIEHRPSTTPYTTSVIQRGESTTENDDIKETEKPEPQKCIYEHNADESLVAHLDDEMLTDDAVLSPSQTLTFRCQNITSQILVGTNNLVCAENGWRGNIPKCEVLSYRNPDNAPVITYEIWKGESYIAPNGSLYISENAEVTLYCWWLSNPYGLPRWSWNRKNDTEISQVRTQKNGNESVELTVDVLKKEHAGLYSCSNPREQEHGIDIRIIAPKIQPTQVTTITSQLPGPITTPPITARLSTVYRTLRPMTPAKQITTPTFTTCAQLQTASRTWQPLRTITIIKPTQGTTETTIKPTQATTETTIKPTQATTETTITTIKPTQMTPEITKLPTTTIKEREEYPSDDDCLSMEYDGLIIHENDRLLDRAKSRFSSPTWLVFRCKDYLETKLEGATRVRCFKGNWSRSWPTCKQIFADNWDSPPPVSVSSTVDATLLDNGDFLFPVGSGLYFHCFFYLARPAMVMYVNGSLVSLDTYRKDDEIDEPGYYYVVVEPTKTVQTYTFTCSTPLRPTPEERYSNTITVRTGGRCVFPDAIKDRVKKKIPVAVIFSWSLRGTYREGDIIKFGCSKRISHREYMPDGIICIRDGRWKLKKKVQTPCTCEFESDC